MTASSICVACGVGAFELEEGGIQLTEENVAGVKGRL
jgi:hypothetical protein